MVDEPLLMHSITRVQELENENEQLKAELETHRRRYNYIRNPDLYLKSLLRLSLAEFLNEYAACKKNLFVMDIDILARTHNNCFQIFEIKQNGKKLAASQRNSYLMLDGVFKELSKIQNRTNLDTGLYTFKTNGQTYHYYGYHELTFDGLNPKTSKIYLDEKEITYDQLVSIFSFKDVCQSCYKRCVDAEPCNC